MSSSNRELGKLANIIFFYIYLNMFMNVMILHRSDKPTSSYLRKSKIRSVKTPKGEETSLYNPEECLEICIGIRDKVSMLCANMWGVHTIIHLKLLI